jgi:hypothetical protein
MAICRRASVLAVDSDPGASPLLGLLLQLVFRQRITAPDGDAGLADLAAGIDRGASVDQWRTAVADALASGYVHDPVRLTAGALQCHWHLELTPKGVEAARRLQPAKGDVA